MSLWTTLTKPFRRRAAETDFFNAMFRDDPHQFLYWLAANQAAGEPITMDNCLQLSIVWACVSVITNSIGTCPWNIYSVNGERREVLHDDPLAYLLNVRPNPDMTAISFREAMLFNALTWGNGYAEIVKDRAQRVVELWPLLSDRVVPRRDSGNEDALYYQYTQMDGSTTPIPANKVFHLRGPGISGLLGDNVVARAAKSMSLTAAAETFASTYFGNNTVLGGFLEYPKALDKPTFDRLRESWEDRFRGPKKSNKPAILENGMKWHPIDNDAQKSQLIEARKFQLEEICRWYGVPPHKIQHLDRMTYNNVEHLAIEFVRDAVYPWTTRFEQEADYKLFSPRGANRRTKLDTSWLMYGDSLTRAQMHQIYRRIGVYSANDILQMEGKNSIGSEGDVRIVEANMQTLEQLKLLADDPEAALKQANAPAPKGAEPGDNQPAKNPDQKRMPAAVSTDLLAEAIVTLFSSGLDRYVRRLRKREEDLKKNSSRERTLINLAHERERLRPWLIEECTNAIALAHRARGVQISEQAVLLAADAVDNGAEPLDAATKLLKEAVA